MYLCNECKQLFDRAGSVSEVAAVWKENTQCGDHSKSGVIFLMVKYRGLIEICGSTNWIVCLYPHWRSWCVRSQPAVWCKSSGSPEKQVSQLFISCQVLGFRTGMRSVCKGCWGVVVVNAHLFGGGGWRILFFLVFPFFFVSNFTNVPVKHGSGCSLMFRINTWLLPGINRLTFTPIETLPLIVSIHCALVLLCFWGQGTYIEFCISAEVFFISFFQDYEVEAQWRLMNDLFCFSWTTKQTDKLMTEWREWEWGEQLRSKRESYSIFVI